MEGDDGAGIVAGADDLDGAERLALGIPLLEDLSLAVHLGDQEVGKGVDAGDAHAMEASGHLVAVLGELAAGVQDRQDDLEGRTVLLGMHVRRDASAVVLNPDGVVLLYGHVYLVAEAGHGFVDTVVNHFIYQVVKAPLCDVSDVHRRSFPHSLKPFEDLDAIGGILLFRYSRLFVFYHYRYIKNLPVI